jgi:hypothetical protein
MMTVERLFVAIAAMLGGTAVAAGAFATHALRAQLSDRLLTVFETGARYQMYHALALVLVALVRSQGLGSPGLLTTAGKPFWEPWHPWAVPCSWRGGAASPPPVCWGHQNLRVDSRDWMDG